MTVRQAAAWVMPAAALLILLSAWPLVFSVVVSLRAQDGSWTLDHFARMAKDRVFLVAAWQTVRYTAVALAAEFLLGLSLALLVDSLPRYRGVFRAGMLVPMLVPPIVAAVIWRLMFNPQFGVINGTLRLFGVDTAALTWTSGESWALASVILVDIWEWTPFLFLVLSAGLQAIPPDPVEAARLDGANAWQVFRDVELPLLKPVIALAVMLRAMDLVRIFDQIWILTQGGPGYATETVSLYIYRNAFRFFNFGYAAAMSFCVLLVTILFARGVLRLMRREAV